MAWVGSLKWPKSKEAPALDRAIFSRFCDQEERIVEAASNGARGRRTLLEALNYLPPPSFRGGR